MREPFIKEFNLTGDKTNITMSNLYEYSDVILSMQFEGIPTRV